MLEDMLDDIAKSLGVPKRIFEGEPHSSTISYGLEKRDHERLTKLRDIFSDKVIQPLIEKNLPDLYWETAYILSPRGRVLRKRVKPVEIVWK